MRNGLDFLKLPPSASTDRGARQGRRQELPGPTTRENTIEDTRRSLHGGASKWLVNDLVELAGPANK